MSQRPLSPSGLTRLRASLRVSRLLAWAVVVDCVVLAGVLVHGVLVAGRLGQWSTLWLGLAGLVLVLGLAGLTLGLVRRQRRILEAGETLIGLWGTSTPAEGAEPQNWTADPED